MNGWKIFVMTTTFLTLFIVGAICGRLIRDQVWFDARVELEDRIADGFQALYDKYPLDDEACSEWTFNSRPWLDGRYCFYHEVPK